MSVDPYQTALKKGVAHTSACVEHPLYQSRIPKYINNKTVFHSINLKKKSTACVLEQVLKLH